MKTIIKTFALLVGVVFVLVTAANGQTTIDVSNPAGGTGYEVSNGVITITQGGEYVLTGTTTSNRVVVGQGVAATITLSNVSITSAVGSPLELSEGSSNSGDGSGSGGGGSGVGANVTLMLVGVNTLTSTVPDSEGEDRFSAGLQVEGSASLTIEDGGSPISSSPTSGRLTATGGLCAAGIGSGCIERVDGTTVTITPGTIVIKSGIINATGGYVAAGIGGGYCASGGSVTISGGSVTVTGGELGGAGIGGGYYGATGNIAITGGSVTAGGGKKSAGIGSGAEASGGSNVINITGGSVTAGGGEWGAGIGSGAYTSGGNDVINISGGIIAATGGMHGAAIGSGCLGSIGSINISGGVILAITTNGAAAIGSGFYDDQPGGSAGNIRIAGGSVFAYTNVGGYGEGAGIGTGSTGTSEGSINITGGSVVARLIGVSSSSGRTPTAVSGGIILTNTINAESFGNGNVCTGANLTEAFVRATFENASKAGSGDTVVVEIPGATVHDTVTQIVHDTLRQEIIVHDTLIETQFVHDTLETFIVLESATGAEFVVEDSLRIMSYGGEDMYFIRGLSDEDEFCVYDSQGALVYCGTTQPVRLVGRGLFIVGQGGKYWKVVK